MANQAPNNDGFNGGQFQIQTQTVREELANQPSDIHNQGTFIQDSGSPFTNMAHGAAEMGKGAAQSAMNIARGAATGAAHIAQDAATGAAHIAQDAATGAAHIAQGAADAVKNTIGANNHDITTHPSNPTSKPNSPRSPSSMV